MNSWNKKPLLTIFLFVLLTWNPVFAGDLPGGMNDFVHKFLAAAKQQDGDALKKLSHNTVQKCTTDARQRTFYDQFVERTIKSFSVEGPIMKMTFQQFTPQDLQKMATGIKKSKITWPVNPDGRVIILYSAYHKMTRLAINVKHDVDGWKWVPFCRKKEQEKDDPVACVHGDHHNHFTAS